MTGPISVDVDRAAELTGVSSKTVRRAITSRDPAAFPPPLKAYRNGAGQSAKYLIKVADLEAWIASFPLA